MSVEAEREVSTSPHCEPDRMANIATSILSENFGRLLRPVRRLLQRRCPEHRSRHTLLRPLQQTLPEWLMSQSGSDVHALSLSHGPNPVRRSMRLQHSLKPKGPGNNDRSTRERLVNVVTSLPFLAVGFHTRKAQRTPEGRRFGSCLMAVGASATAYHAASGKLRTSLRKLDYWTIALASTQMARALFPPTSPCLRALNAASWALTPFQPTVVSTLNFGIAEVAFAREALGDRSLRKQYRRHAAIGGFGLGCFMLEDVAIEHGHSFVHSLWHLHSCYAVASANALMQRREQKKAAVTELSPSRSALLANGMRQ